MKLAIAALALLLLGAAPVETRPVYAGLPPLKYMGAGMAVTIFTNDVESLCGPAAPGYGVLACHKRTKKGHSVIVLPNPCLFPNEYFATLACHEKAHGLGWPADHPY